MAILEEHSELTMIHAFTRAHRLLTPKDFQTVLDGVDVKSINEHFVLLARKTHHKNGRLGFIITKKVFKRAVDRNRVRRLMRENFRQTQSQWVGFDIVVISRKGQKLKASEEVLSKIGRLWWVLRKRCENFASC